MQLKAIADTEIFTGVRVSPSAKKAWAGSSRRASPRCRARTSPRRRRCRRSPPGRSGRARRGRGRWARDRTKRPDRRRHAHEGGQPEREGQGLAEGGLVASRGLLRERRQDRGRDGDAEDPERELDQPVRVVEVGDAALRQERRDDRVDDRADVAWPTGPPPPAPSARGSAGPPGAGSRSAAPPARRRFAERGTCMRSWPRPPEEDAHRRGPITGSASRGASTSAPTMMPTLSATGDRAGSQEVAVGVEDAHGQRGQPHEEEVREHEAGQAHGQLARCGVREEAGRHDADDPRRGQDAQEGQTAAGAAASAPATARSMRELSARERVVAYSVKTGMKADERAPSATRRRRRFGRRKATKKASVTRPGAEGPGDHEVAEEAEDPAGQRGGAHHGGRARHRAPGARRRRGGAVAAVGSVSVRRRPPRSGDAPRSPAVRAARRASPRPALEP